MTDELRNFLEISLPKVKEVKKPKFSLRVSDSKIESHIFEETKIPFQNNEFVLELIRGIRLHLDKLIEGLKPGDLEKLNSVLATVTVVQKSNSMYGEIVDVNLVRDKGTGKSKGFAFVAYEDQRSTVLAVDNLNGAQVLGRIIRVDHVTKYKNKEEEYEEEEQQRKREEREVCRAFQRGECTHGAGCKFSHNEQYTR